MVYNMTNVTSIGDFLVKANEVTPFWLGINFMIWIILTITFLSFGGFEVALLGSSFISFVIGMLLAYAGLMTWKWTMFWLGMIILVILYIAYNRKDS